MSLSKLLVLVVIVAAIWYGFKWLGRGGRAATSNEPKDGGARTEQDSAAPLAECPACNTFVPESLGKCPEGRSNCPMFGG